jgi:hypothetical protein
MAEDQGLKFTFGSDTSDREAGRLDYCRDVAGKGTLRRDNHFVPERSLRNS